MVENDESMDAPKSVLFHWKYNNYEKDAKSSYPLTLQNLSISLRNIKILKIGRSNQKCKKNIPGTCTTPEQCQSDGGQTKGGACNGGSDNVCCVSQ